MFAVTWASAHGQHADNYPSKGLKIVVPSPAGGGVDTLGRLIANWLEAKWKQPVVVENRPGASGNIGANIVAKSAPDGYTILLGTTVLLQVPHTLPNMPFDPTTAFIPVSMIARSTNIFAISASVPATTLKEYIALVKANPDKYTYGSYGNGTSSHIQAELLKSQTGMDMIHVPYKGSAPLIMDLIGGQVPGGFVDIASVKSHLKSGKLRNLAVTGAARNPLLPDVPTLKELGFKDFEPVAWYGVFVPAGTPREIVTKISNEVTAYLKSQEGMAKIESLGLQVSSEKGEEFARIYKEDANTWAKVIKSLKIKVD